MKTNNNNTNNINGAKRPIDVYFEQCAQRYPSIANKLVLTLLLLLFYFGLMGICWIIPFPEIKWLGSYFNWASFLIAGLVYFWLKQSPILSYFLLIVLFAVSYAVSRVQIGIAVNAWVIYASVTVAACIILLSMFQKKQLSPFKSLFMMPLWLVSFPAKSFGARI